MAFVAIAFSLPLGAPGAAWADASTAIVGGAPTSDWPSVGTLDTGAGTCSVTLVGCRTVLTAAHCVCDPGGTGAPCPDGTSLLDPDDYLVFFQNAGDQDPFSPSFGQYPVSAVHVHPSYQFGVSSDVALLELEFPVRGIAPAPINTLASPANGTSATIVGFGTTTLAGPDSGVKREGAATTESCSGVPDSTHVCWSMGASTTCSGDSGGPLFADVGAGVTVAGVHSGGAPLCDVNAVAYDADVYFDASWISGAAGADLGASACGDGSQVGDLDVTTTVFGGVVSNFENHSFPLAANTKVLRVSLNAEVGTTPNDFDLLLRQGAAPTQGQHDCFPELLGSLERCEIVDPVSGTWHIKVDVFDGGPGEYQVTVTQIPENPAPPAPGPGDLVVADFLSWEIFQVDRGNGARSIVSSQLRGVGPMLAGPEGVLFDGSGDVLVANLADRSVLKIDPTSGDRTLLSGCSDFPCSSVVGSGLDLFGPRFLALEGTGDVLVADRSDSGDEAIVRVDPITGNRTTVSGCADVGCTTVTGAGANLDTPFGIVVEAGGEIVVADASGLVRIDPITGDRTPVVGSGESFRQPRGISIESGGDFLVVDGDPVAPALFLVDAGTGARSVLSGCADAACNSVVGTGPLFQGGLLDVDTDLTGAPLVTDGEQGAIFRVDVGSGDRQVLSGCTDAGCSSAAGSGTLFTSPAGLAVPVPEPAVGLGLLAGIGLLLRLHGRRRG